MEFPDSSVIRTADYDPEARTLDVTFKSGRRYSYFGVPDWEFDGLVTATSASTGAIMPAAAASARGSTAGRRSGAGADDQVTVTDSHHPALRMAPAGSSRRQCPRDSCTCRGQSPWLSRGTE